MNRYERIDAVLTALGEGATVQEVEYALRDHVTREVIAVLADRAGAGSGPATASELPFVPAGTVAATDVQAAIEEVSTEGAAFNGGTITDGLLIERATPGAALDLRATNMLSANDLLVCKAAGGENVFEVFGGGGFYAATNDAANDGVYVQPLVAPNAGVNVATFTGSSGTNTVQVSRNAYLKIKATAAPADAELNASECAFWFDSTNGAAKLMIKAKQADGTVRTGEVALT